MFICSKSSFPNFLASEDACRIPSWTFYSSLLSLFRFTSCASLTKCAFIWLFIITFSFVIILVTAILLFYLFYFTLLCSVAGPFGLYCSVFDCNGALKLCYSYYCYFLFLCFFISSFSIPMIYYFISSAIGP